MHLSVKMKQISCFFHWEALHNFRLKHVRFTKNKATYTWLESLLLYLSSIAPSYIGGSRDGPGEFLGSQVTFPPKKERIVAPARSSTTQLSTFAHVEAVTCSQLVAFVPEFPCLHLPVRLTISTSPSHVCHDIVICVTWLTHMCYWTYSHVWHDSFTHMT